MQALGPANLPKKGLPNKTKLSLESNPKYLCTTEGVPSGCCNI